MTSKKEAIRSLMDVMIDDMVNEISRMVLLCWYVCMIEVMC